MGIDADRDAIAVVSMAASFPGGGPEELWGHVLARRSLVAEIPDERWPVAGMVDPALAGPDRAAHRRACLLGPLGELPADVGVDRALLERLDPLFRLTLRVGVDAWRGARTAGVDPDRVGVVLANIALPTDGASRLAEEILGEALIARALGVSRPPLGAGRGLDRGVMGLPAALLARVLGLGGGVVSLDAACASSLYALHLASAALRAGRIDAALAGGVSRPQCLYTQVGFSQLQALSPSGICRPFDARADGLVVGEGAGLFVLKRLPDALLAGDVVLGVLRGLGLSNDRGGSLLAPDAEGQGRAMERAWRQAGWRPSEVPLVECHGTGTPLGDATEIVSLKTLWHNENSRTPAVIGSVKSNVGHLLTAAGAAGLVKVLLALREGILPPTANVDPEHPAPALADAPLRVLDAPELWPAGRPRRAALSAFGFGGINAHVLIEAWDGGQAHPRPATPRPWSAPQPLAIVGIGAHLGDARSPTELRALLLGDTAAFAPIPTERRGGLDGDVGPELPAELRGRWISALTIPVGRFRVPPTELSALLPQHLLALEVATDAVEDARRAWSAAEAPRRGVVFALNQDLDATRFHLRWRLPGLLREVLARHHAEVTEAEIAAWLAAVLAHLEGLDAPRVMGNLGGMVASRVARDVGAGGPAFGVSAEEVGGVRALQVAADLLSAGDVDVCLVGGVEVWGALALAARGAEVAWADTGGGPRPGEGAAAVVLKPLAAAQRDGDAVYAVIRGLGGAGGGAGFDPPTARTMARAARQAMGDDRLGPSGMVLLHGSGDPAEDAVDAAALLTLAGPADRPGRAVVAPPLACGSTGAASGLVGLLCAALALRHRVVPGRGASAPSDGAAWETRGLHTPRGPSPWIVDGAEGPRRALVTCLAWGGEVGAVWMEEAAAPASLLHGPAIGPDPAVLFLLDADDPQALHHAWRALTQRAQEAPDAAGVAALAARWCAEHPPQEGPGRWRKALVVGDLEELRRILSRPLRPTEALGGDVAFVYPGSGSHYLGMGRALGLTFPGVLRRLEGETDHLAAQLLPDAFAPWRATWPADWEAESRADIDRNTAVAILGQVSHGILVHDVLTSLGLHPQAAIGYSLGESTALLANRAWPQRDAMFDRVRRSPLFQDQLSGRCEVARRVWELPEVRWRAAVVPCPADAVRAALVGTARLLIVNAPEECVIGGHAPDVDATTAALGVALHPLEGVPTVHCEVVSPVAEAYHALHLQPTVAPAGLRFYSGAWGRAYPVDAAGAADAILANALHGLDFPRTIRQAWEDGARIFVEVGPGGSCTRMIRHILADRPHMAVSACREGAGARALLDAVGRAFEAGAAVDVRPLLPVEAPPARPSRTTLSVSMTGAPIEAPGLRRRPPEAAVAPHAPPAPPAPPKPEASIIPCGTTELTPITALVRGLSDLLADGLETHRSTGEAHARFLALQAETTRTGIEALRRLELAARGAPVPDVPRALETEATPVFLDREACLRYATGRIADVLGADFAEADAFPTRVRLPDEPLMLVDRILTVEGEAGSLGAGRVVTEHDVLPGAWYLDGGRAPVCISVEAGQADLFLSGWLGIDRHTRGLQVYRLLDAEVVFHTDLPQPGDVLRYDIHIDRFLRHGSTWLFFFRFNGFIGTTPFITMRDGCAGFFDPETLAEGKGLVGEPAPKAAPPRPGAAPFRPLVEDRGTPPNAGTVEVLRRGDLEAAFGPAFAGKLPAPGLTLPGGKMALIDRIVALEPGGGTWGLGRVQAEADIDPQGWYLTCHFVDDQVYPGTLMYEGCLHTLRVLLSRLGWIGSPSDEVHLAPIPGVPSRLRCRGQVVAETGIATFTVEIKAMGYDPEPYVIAEAVLSARGKDLVRFGDVSARIVGADQARMEAAWRSGPTPTERPALYDRDRILSFCIGKPSDAFGAPYLPFDEDRRIARLPGPPFCFMDRVVAVDAPPWKMAPTGWIEAEYDVPPDAWYFTAARTDRIPFAVILETALQPCGWLAAYVGSALRSDHDLHFRNLEGEATLHQVMTRDVGRVSIRVRLKEVSEAGGMILQSFDMGIHRGEVPLYTGWTRFGFFPTAALAEQVGIRGADARRWRPDSLPPPRLLPREMPLRPEDAASTPAHPSGLHLPAGAWLMVDRLDLVDPLGGPAGLGAAIGSAAVNPDAWFFAAHFYQDPVMPGSLGLEALLQLLQTLARERWPHLREGRIFSPIAVGRPHRWWYRGQVIPSARRVQVEVNVTAIQDGPLPAMTADGFLSVDNRVIYEVRDFTITLDEPLISL